MFPQLVAGPIVRYGEIAPQMSLAGSSLDRFSAGVRRFCTGFAKKILIADMIAPVVDKIYGLPADEFCLATAWTGTLLFGLQIFFDFSGYSDMAIGLGRMIGLDFPENFAHPYTATSLRDFWRRWHMTLSRWLRDYLYLPLGGNRRGPTRTYLNLLLTMVLGGLWHGAGGCFIVWGMYHGILLAGERYLREKTTIRLPATLRRIATWTAVFLGWGVFRARDLQQLRAVVSAMVGLRGVGALDAVMPSLHAGVLVAVCAGCFIAVGLHVNLVRVGRRVLERCSFSAQQRVMIIAYTGARFFELGIFMVSLAIVACTTYRPFIYFQF